MAGESIQATDRSTRAGRRGRLITAGKREHVTTVAKKPLGFRGWPQRILALKPIAAIGRLLIPRVLVALGVPVMAGIAFAGYYYADLSAQIDSRLVSGPLDNAVDVYSGPLVICVGERLPAGVLADYLRGLGYTQRQPEIGRAHV